MKTLMPVSNAYVVYKYFLVMLVISFCVSNVYAYDLTIDSKIKSVFSQNDNARLSSPKSKQNSVSINPSASVNVREADWNVLLDTDFRTKKNSDASLNRDEYTLSLFGQKKVDTNVFNSVIKYQEISSLNQQSINFGQTSDNIIQKIISISPSYRKKVTERIDLTINLNYTDRSDNEIVNSIVDSTSITGSSSLSYLISEKSSAIASVSLTDSKSKDNSSDFRLIVASLELRHKVSKRLSTEASLGFSFNNSVRRTTQSIFFQGTAITPADVSSHSNGVVANASLNYQYINSLFSLVAKRNETANSFGGVSRNDSLSLNFNHQFTNNFNFSVKTDYSQTNSNQSNGAFSDRILQSLTASINYSITKYWSLIATFSNTRRKFTNISSDVVEANVINAGLQYNFPTLTTF